MKKLTLIIFLLLATQISIAQITFQKIFGGTSIDDGNSIIQTIDGGFIIAGTTASFGTGLYDVYLIQTNSYGDTIWTRTFGGLSNDYGYMVQQTSDEGYIIVGTTYSFGAGNSDIYLIKTDTNGHMIWSKAYGGASYEEGYSVCQNTDGGFIITGWTLGSGVGSRDIYVIRTTANGDTLWTKTYGGSGNDWGYSVKQTNDGGYIITGYSYGLGVGNTQVILIKTDSNGDITWVKTFGGPKYCWGFSVQQTIDGGYIIAGSTNSFGISGNDMYLIKTDVNGNLLWSKTFGGVLDDICNFVQQTTDGGYIIAGITQSFGAGSYDVYLIKTDSIGNMFWAKTYGGSNYDYGFSVQQTTDGGYIVIARTASFFGVDNIYVIKTDVNGNSGCNELITNTSVTSPATITSNPTIQVSSFGTVCSSSSQEFTGGTVNILCTVETNETNLTIHDVNIFPNPAHDKLTITTTAQQKQTLISIINMQGQLIKQIPNPQSSGPIEIDVSAMAKGIYLVKVQTETGITNKKLIIQ